VASKTAIDNLSITPEAIEEMLDLLDKTLDRLKVLYEQYFLGIQKQAPAYLHTDVERKLRDLTQISIRNTGLRYRYATLQQKFGSYNSYWRRTLRQIENGTYARNLSKIGRQAARTGEEIPEEILAAMPKRMREQVVRDREQALAAEARRKIAKGGDVAESVTIEADEPPPPELEEDAVAMISEPTELRRNLKTRGGAHVLDESDAAMDLDSFFASVEQEKASVKPTGPAPHRAASMPAPQQRPSSPVIPPARQTGPVRVPEPAPSTKPLPPTSKPTTEIKKPVPPGTDPGVRQSRPIMPTPAAGTGVVPKTPAAIGPKPLVPPPPTAAKPSAPQTATSALPKVPAPTKAPSQVTRPNPIAPGSAAARGPVEVESMSGPFPRAPQQAAPPAARPAQPRPPSQPRPEPPPPMKPPPGMTDADVNALYAKYVKAKEMVGETVGPGGQAKLLRTINAQAPKIMEQYKAKAVDFSIVVKDNQVIIRAKPKT
jgi:hypothetical protein